MNEDGLSSLSYTVISAEYNLLYNNITVDISESNWKIEDKNETQSTIIPEKQHYLSAYDNLNLTSKLVSEY